MTLTLASQHNLAIATYYAKRETQDFKHLFAGSHRITIEVDDRFVDQPFN
jgi:hypothetical protein